MKWGEKVGTAVEVRARTGDLPVKKPPFSRKNLSSEDFKDILLRVNDTDTKSDKSVAALVEPKNDETVKLNQDKQNEQQSDDNQDNGLLYEEYMSPMCISMMNMNLDTKYVDNVVLLEAGAKNQIPSRDGADILQEKTVPQKLPDAVKVANESEPTVLVSKVEEISVRQEVVSSSRSVVHSQVNVVDAQTKPALTVDAQTTADQAKSNDVKNNSARNLSDQGDLQFKANFNRTGADNVAKVTVVVGNVAQNQVGPIINNKNNTMIEIPKNVSASQGKQNGNTDEQNDSDKGNSTSKIYQSAINVTGQKGVTFLEHVIVNGVTGEANEVVRLVNVSDSKVANSEVKAGISSDGQDNAAPVAERKDSEAFHDKQVTVAVHKVHVTDEPLHVNAAPQNVISSKEPVIISELPQKISRLMEQAKEKDYDKPIFLQLKLEPEQLGELVIKLTYKKGEMSAQFITSSLQAKEALENTMKQLKDALAQQQVILHEPVVSVGFSGEQSMQHSRQNFNGKKYTQNFYKSNGSVDEGEDEVEGVSRHNDVMLSGKAVDYVI